MNVEIGTETTQYPEKEYMNGILVAVFLQYRTNPASSRNPYIGSSPILLLHVTFFRQLTVTQGYWGALLSSPGFKGTVQ